MKKLILSMLIVLGTIVSTQAQFRVWNFSCGPVDNSAPIIEAEWSVLSDGFSAEQIESIEDRGYVMSNDANGNEVLVRIFTGVDLVLSSTYTQENATPKVSVQVGSFVRDNNPALGSFAYRVLIVNPNGGGYVFQHFFVTAETTEVLDFLLNIYPDADPLMVYQDGYPDADEDVLVDIGFMFDTTMSQYVLHRSANDWVYIPAPNADGSYTYENADTDVVDGTLAEILANYEING